MEYRQLAGSQLDSTCLEILATKVPKDRSVGWLRSTLPGAPDSIYTILPFYMAVDTSLNFIDWTMLSMYQFENPPSYINKLEELYDINYFSLSLSIRAQLSLLSNKYKGLESLLKRFDDFIKAIDEPTCDEKYSLRHGDILLPDSVYVSNDNKVDQWRIDVIVKGDRASADSIADYFKARGEGWKAAIYFDWLAKKTNTPFYYIYASSYLDRYAPGVMSQEASIHLCQKAIVNGQGQMIKYFNDEVTLAQIRREEHNTDLYKY